MRTTSSNSDNQARQELARTRQAINQFISSCSSGIRTPMNSIPELANLLTSVQSREEKLVVLSVIRQRTSQMESLLDSLQAFMTHIDYQEPSQRKTDLPVDSLILSKSATL